MSLTTNPGHGGITASKYTLTTNGVLVLRTPAAFGVGDNQKMQEACDFASKTAPATINA